MLLGVLRPRSVAFAQHALRSVALTSRFAARHGVVRERLLPSERAAAFSRWAIDAAFAAGPRHRPQCSPRAIARHRSRRAFDGAGMRSAAAQWPPAWLRAATSLSTPSRRCSSASLQAVHVCPGAFGGPRRSSAEILLSIAATTLRSVGRCSSGPGAGSGLIDTEHMCSMPARASDWMSPSAASRPGPQVIVAATPAVWHSSDARL